MCHCLYAISHSSLLQRYVQLRTKTNSRRRDTVIQVSQHLWANGSRSKKDIKNAKQETQHLSRSCAFSLRCLFCRRHRTRYWVLCIINCHAYTQTLFVGPDGRCEHGRCVDLLHGLLEPPTAHGNPEDDHLWGERLSEKGDTVQLDSSSVYSRRTWTQHRKCSRHSQTQR
jgi:hypothetical protein